MKYSKVWGITSPIFQNSMFEVHRIEINAGGYCSKHYHKYKYNVFYIESGKMKIINYEDGNSINETLLSCGEQTTVSPNEFHRFEALEKTIAYEIYYSEFQSDDIIREDEGGINEKTIT